MARVLALVDDIFFQAKLLETAKQVGLELKCVTTSDELNRQIQDQAPDLVIIDLNARAGGVEALEKLPPGNPVRVIAFLSHVQVELAERARRAGCSDVMPRSKFTQNLASIFAQTKAEHP
jgi:CheY-like chemotaxis protein